MSDINTGVEQFGNDLIERAESAAEKYGVECHGVPLNVGWFLDLLDAAVEKERAEERAEIRSELMGEMAMLNETKMTVGDLKCFAYRIKAIVEQMYEQDIK